MACVAAISDLHLGLGIFSDDDSHRLITLKKAVQIGAEHDLLLIPANLFFTKSQPSRELVARTLSILEKCPVPVVINTASEEAFFSSIKFPENVYCCSGTTRISSAGTDYVINCIYADEPSKLATVTRSQGARHLTLVNTGFDPLSSGLNPVLIRKLTQDFYFFGGSNDFRVYRYTGTVFGLFPGAAEPCSYHNCSDTYAVSVCFNGTDPVILKRYTITTAKLLRYECDSVNREFLDKISTETGTSNIVYIHAEKPVHESFSIQIDELRKKCYRLVIAGPGKDQIFSEAMKLKDNSVRSQLLHRLSAEKDELDYPLISEMLALFDGEQVLSPEALCDYLNA